MLSQVRKEAFKLRRKGWSYNEIYRELGIPKSTLSGWFGEMVLSENASKRLAERKSIGTAVLIKRNKAQTEKARLRAQSLQDESRKEIERLNFSKHELLLVGLALYWGEGHKKAKQRNGQQLHNHPIQLTNSDPGLVQVFVRFLREVMDVPLEDITLSLRLYDHINENAALKYWLSATRLPASCYRGTTRLVSLASTRKKPYNRLPFGTVEIRINRTAQFHRLMGWLGGLKTMLG